METDHLQHQLEYLLWVGIDGCEIKIEGRQTESRISRRYGTSYWRQPLQPTIGIAKREGNERHALDRYETSANDLRPRYATNAKSPVEYAHVIDDETGSRINNLAREDHYA